jgi:hypothetical protein
MKIKRPPVEQPNLVAASAPHWEQCSHPAILRIGLAPVGLENNVIVSSFSCATAQ